MIGDLDVSPLVVLAGFVSALIAVACFLAGRLRLPVHLGGEATGAWPVPPVLAGVVPLALILAGFATGRVNPVWLLIVATAVTVLGGQVLHLLRRLHEARGEDEVAGPSVATALALLVLLEFHWLTVVRLAVVPVPDAPLWYGLGGEAWQAGGLAVLLPAAGLAVAMVVVLRTDPAVRSSPRRPQPAWLRRATAPLLRLWSRLHRPRARLRRIGAALWWRLASVVRPSAFPVWIFLLFLAPATPVLGGQGKLTFLGLATPEYGKVLFVWALALAVKEHVVTAGTAGGGSWWVRNRRILYPAGLFLLVAIPSAIRTDLGPLIPVFVGTLGMMWCALRDEAARRVGSGSAGRWAAQRVAWPIFRRDLAIPGLVIAIFVATAAFTDYVQVRLEVQQDAWVYNWSPQCDPVPEGVTPPPGPNGSGVCLRNLRSAQAANRSQVAKAGAAVADGGIFGRGLTDTASRIVPLAATDFVVAAVWSKLGGLVVLGFGALLALLAAALSRAVWLQRKPKSGDYDTVVPPADRSRLFAAGLTASILGQFVFVVAATLNWLPHSGITAPLLSRGGQSTLALSVGVVIALAVAYRGDPAPSTAGPAAPPSPRAPGAAPRAAAPPLPGRPLSVGPALVAVVAVAAVLWGTFLPYGGHPENRPLCRQDPPKAVVDADVCSTDLLAYGRTRQEVGLPDGSRFRRSHTGSGWEPAGPGPGPGPDATSLAGLLTVPGGGQGLAEAAMPNVFAAGVPVTLAGRLSPHVRSDRPDAVAELTVVPRLQGAALDALTADAPAPALPLAGGIVVLDARTSHVLAAATAPRTIADPSGPPLDITTQQRSDFENAHPYGKIVGGAPRDQPDQCLLRAPILGNDPDCFRWYPTGRPKVAEDAQKAENERYVGGGPERAVAASVERPDPAVNRAVGDVHGPGSTFKVVVAAAFLRTDPTASWDTPIFAPAVSRFPDGQIRRNFSLDGREQVYCRGATAQNPYITLKQALAVSCNTAFVELARSIGWDAIRDTAVGFGFGVRGEERPVPLAESSLGAVSVVPRTAPGSAIGNVALGGGEVDASPLQMASVMATIANEGHFVQPSIATALRKPGDAATTAVQPDTADPLTKEVASRLKDALAGTADPRCNGCTARLLERPDDHDIWVKTGTQVVTRPDPPATPGTPQPYAQEYSWLAGFMATPQGPVAFAVTLEAGKGDGSGSARARFVIAKVLQAIAEERG